MTPDSSVQEYIAMQPRLTRRRKAMYAFFKWLAFSVLWKVRVTGAEQVPPDGPAMVIINHVSTIDPVLAIGAVTNRFVVPMSKVENMDHWLFRWFITNWGAFVVKRGEVDRKALQNSIELLKSGQLILLAPEGTRHPNGLTEAKDGMAYIATKANAVIIPMGLSHEATTWLTKLKRLQQPHIRINIGRPFRFKVSGDRVPREQLTAMTHEAMYQLAAALPDEHMRGVYSDLSKATTQYIEFV